MNDLHLRDRIRALSLDTGEVDPPTVAEKLIGELTVEQKLAALAIVLPDYVRRVLGSPWPEPDGSAASEPGKGRHPGPAVKAAYYRELHRVYLTGEGQKRLRDCTAADLDFLEADRRRQATDLVAAADEFGRARAALEKYRKRTVGALPKVALDAVFGGAW